MGQFTKTIVLRVLRCTIFHTSSGFLYITLLNVVRCSTNKTSMINVPNGLFTTFKIRRRGYIQVYNFHLGRVLLKGRRVPQTTTLGRGGIFVQTLLYRVTTRVSVKGGGCVLFKRYLGCFGNEKKYCARVTGHFGL